MQKKDFESGEPALLFLRGLYARLIQLLAVLDAGKKEIVYMTGEELEDVKRVAGLVARHPELTGG